MLLAIALLRRFPRETEERRKGWRAASEATLLLENKCARRLNIAVWTLLS